MNYLTLENRKLAIDAVCVRMYVCECLCNFACLGSQKI